MAILNGENDAVRLTADIAAIDAKVTSGNTVGLATETEVNKIDTATSDGASGVPNSVAWRIEDIQCRSNCYDKWFQPAAIPSGETHVADRIGEGAGKFQIDAGNDDWGAWLQILGSSDTPDGAGNTRYQVHRLGIVSTELNISYFVQIGFGISGAAALVAGTYADAEFKPQSNQADSAPIHIFAESQPVGTKAWVRCKAEGQNTGTMDFNFSLREDAAVLE